MENSVQLRKQRHDLLMKSRSVLERAGSRDLNTEEASEYDKLQASMDELAKRIKRLEDQEQAESEDDKPVDDDSDKDKDEDRDDDEEQSGRSRKSMWADFERRSDRSFFKHLGSEGSKLSSNEYRKAYSQYLRTGKVPSAYRDLSLTGGDGAGSLVTPTAISKDFVTFLNAYTFIRDLAHVEYVNDAQSLGNPRLTTDISDADWTAEVPESDISGDTSMAMDRRDLTPNLLTKMELVSMRELMLAPQVENIVLSRLAYKFAVSEENGFLTGDGSSQPLGVFTASSSGISTGRDITASSTTGFNADDLLACTEGIAQQYTVGDKFCWIMSRAAVLRARKLKDGQGNYLYGVSLAAGRPDTLCGYALKKSEFAPATFTTGLYVAILGNFDFYRIALVGNGAPAVQVLNERYSPTNQIGYIGREWIDGAPVREEAFTRLILA